MTELSYIQISPNDPRSVLPTYWLVLGKYHLNTPPRANVTSHIHIKKTSFCIHNVDSTYSYHKSVSYRSGFPLELNHVRILTVHVSCIVSLTRKCLTLQQLFREKTSPGPGPSRSMSNDDVFNELVLLENIYVSLKT